MSKKTKPTTYTGRNHSATKKRPNEHRIRDIEPHIFHPNARLCNASTGDVDLQIRQLLENRWSVDEVAVQLFRGDRETVRNFYKPGVGMCSETIDNPRFVAFRERVERISEELKS